MEKDRQAVVVLTQAQADAALAWIESEVRQRSDFIQTVNSENPYSHRLKQTAIRERNQLEAVEKLLTAQRHMLPTEDAS